MTFLRSAQGGLSLICRAESTYLFEKRFHTFFLFGGELPLHLDVLPKVLFYSFQYPCPYSIRSKLAVNTTYILYFACCLLFKLSTAVSFPFVFHFWTFEFSFQILCWRQILPLWQQDSLWIRLRRTDDVRKHGGQFLLYLPRLQCPVADETPDPKS